MLRSQLVEVQTKMSRLLATVQLLSDSVSKTLDGTTGDATVEEVEEDELERDDSEQTYRTEPFVGPSLQTPVGMDSFTTAPDSFSLIECSPSGEYLTLTASHLLTRTVEMINVSGTSPLCQQIPNIWNFEYQMGMQPYLDAISATEESGIMLGKEWTLSNSPFSDHIQLLQRLLKTKLNALGLVPHGQQSLRR